MGMQDFKYKEITEKIIGAAMRVHAGLGNGFQELVYQRALDIEMGDSGLRFVREFSMPLFYKGHAIGTRRVDFYVEEKIMLELKAVLQIENAHLAQTKNYLEAYNMEIGLLINFGAISLEFKRLRNQKFEQKK
jgi:GxxExxY protein